MAAKFTRAAFLYCEWMRSRAFRRRSAATVGVYVATGLGFAATVVAARSLGPDAFGLFALALATATFVQVLLDATAEEAAIKYGFRYATRGEWGRLRRLFRVAVEVKIVGAVAAAAVIALIAPAAEALFGDNGLTAPLLAAAALPLVQAPEGVAGAALVVGDRYDVRGLLMAWTAGLRLVGVAIGAQFGPTEALLGLVAGQAVASVLLALLAHGTFARLPEAPPAAIGADARPLRRFVAQSAVTSTLLSARSALGTVLLGLVAPAVQVGYFRAAQAPQTGAAAATAPARLVLLAEQTQDVELGRLDRVWQVLRRYVTTTAAISIVMLPLLWLLMPALVRLVYGDAFDGAVDATRLMTLAAALQVVFGWTKSFPVSIGRPGLRILAHAVELAVLVPLLLLLGARWGATGAAAAGVAATAAFALVWTALLVRLRREPGLVGAVEPVATREAVAR
jgi:O-antigen/teichoic acid export membrane protein